MSPLGPSHFSFIQELPGEGSEPEDYRELLEDLQMQNDDLRQQIQGTVVNPCSAGQITDGTVPYYYY